MFKHSTVILYYYFVYLYIRTYFVYFVYLKLCSKGKYVEISHLWKENTAFVFIFAFGFIYFYLYN